MPYAPSTKPDTIRQVLRHSFLLYKNAFLKVMPLAFVLSFVAFIPRLINYYSNGTPQLASSNSILQYLFFWGIELVDLTLFVILLWRLRCYMHKIKETLKQDMLVSIKKLPRIIGAILVQNAILVLLILIMIGFMTVVKSLGYWDRNHALALMLPFMAGFYLNIYIVVLLIFYLPLILTENKHIFAALGKSASLVWGNWWRTFFTLITPLLTYMLFLIICRDIFKINIHIYFVPLDKVSLPATVFQIVAFAFYIPWFASTLLVELQDLENRKKRANVKA